MKTVYIKRNDLFKNIPLILCNNITKADESFIEDNMNVFFYDCDECKGIGEKDGKACEECDGGQNASEPYQFFLTSLSDYDKEALTSYGVIFGYSNLLDVDVLPIYDFGTSWDCFSYSKEVADDYMLAFNETLKRDTVY